MAAKSEKLYRLFIRVLVQLNPDSLNLISKLKKKTRVADDWSFDDDMATYGCSVFSFDHT